MDKIGQVTWHIRGLHPLKPIYSSCGSNLRIYAVLCLGSIYFPTTNGCRALSDHDLVWSLLHHLRLGALYAHRLGHVSHVSFWTPCSSVCCHKLKWWECLHVSSACSNDFISDLANDVTRAYSAALCQFHVRSISCRTWPAVLFCVCGCPFHWRNMISVYPNPFTNIKQKYGWDSS